MMIIQKAAFILGISVFLCFIHGVNIGIAAPVDVDFLVTESIKKFEQVKDFTCTLEKKVNKNGTIYYDPEIRAKCKKPAHYYFKWVKGRFEGQEVIFDQGRNNNKIVGHSGGLFGFITLRIDPEGSIAMKRNHHPLKRSGLVKIYDILEDSYARHKETGAGTIGLAGEGIVDDRAVWIIRGVFPPDMGFYNAKITLSLDKEHLLPLKVTVYDWSGELYEEYIFHNLKFNVGLNEKDFDPENDKYNF
ncbi:MAG: DUF1571 domain-containing protein [Deltaproteobacteria bacterium]|nr:DUF1571 domain-containing protein [Deltaproteobacteria bacterium]